MTWVIAHRGASWDERENTLPAFERAIEVGADYVELDVQVSADGALVVCHDLDLDRIALFEMSSLADLRRNRDLTLPSNHRAAHLSTPLVGTCQKSTFPNFL